MQEPLHLFYNVKCSTGSIITTAPNTQGISPVQCSYQGNVQVYAFSCSATTQGLSSFDTVALTTPTSPHPCCIQSQKNRDRSNSSVTRCKQRSYHIGRTHHRGFRTDVILQLRCFHRCSYSQFGHVSRRTRSSTHPTQRWFTLQAQFFSSIMFP